MVTNYPDLENLKLTALCIEYTLAGVMVTNYPGLENLNHLVLSCVDRSSGLLIGLDNLDYRD